MGWPFPGIWRVVVGQTSLAEEEERVLAHTADLPNLPEPRQADETRMESAR